MDIEVRFHGLMPSQSLRERALRGLRRRLRRFGRELTAVVVRIADVNGPRGGVDKRCAITAVGRAGPASVEERGEDAYAVVDAAVARLRALRAFVPLCASCKSVRDAGGAWHSIEKFLAEREVPVTHGFCDACAERLYGVER